MNRVRSNSGKLPKYIGKCKVDKLLEEAKKESRRDHLLLLTLFRTGVRVSELINIRKKDIQDGVLMVREGKGKKDRAIPLEENLETLLGYRISDMTYYEKVFDMTRQNVDRIVKKYAERVADIPKISAHILRHSFAVHLLKQGADIVTLNKLLGHKDLNTTKVYLDLTREDVKEIFKKVEW